jgi:hypothetical protein
MSIHHYLLDSKFTYLLKLLSNFYLFFWGYYSNATDFLQPERRIGVEASHGLDQGVVL